MENKNNLNDIEEDKNLYAFQLDDEYDAEKDEDLPTKYELTEDLIYGSKEAKQIVKDIYKDMKFVYGRYNDSNYARQSKIGGYIVETAFLLGSIFVLALAIMWRIYIIILPAMWLLIGDVIIYLYFKKKFKMVWWYKCGRKTATIYQYDDPFRKGDIIIHVNDNYSWRYNNKNGEWSKSNRYFMDARLLFKYLNGYLEMNTLENGQTEIYTCNPTSADSNKRTNVKSASLIIENNIPKIIEYWPESSVMGWRLLKSQRFEFLEINTNRYAEIPKSFIDFCKEQGIEPLEENEHLHYV